MIFALLSLLTVASAIRVTSPTSGSVWSSGDATQTISWNAVSSDPNSFVIQLVNQAGYLPNSPVTISNSQSSVTGDQSATITYPGGTWPVGVAFQINLVTSTASNQAILAQSPQFNISNNGAAQVQSSTGVAPITMSQAVASALAVTTAPSSTATTVTNIIAGDASGGIPNAATSSRAAAMDTASPSALISLLLTGAAFFGVFA